MSIEAELAVLLRDIRRVVVDGPHGLTDEYDIGDRLASAVLEFLDDHDPAGEGQDAGSPLLAFHNWPSNAHMIADIAARFDYLSGHVADLTFGYGNFWSLWKPATFTASDLNPAKSPIGHAVDFTATGFDEASFDSVVLDAPYKLNGTASAPDERYGVDTTEWQGMSWRERHALICRGITECARITRRYVLVKCQDQVNSGHVRWQTDEFTTHAETVGLRKVDSFSMLGGRAQPSGRSQQHARRNCSTLLVFERTTKPTNQGSLL